MNPTLREAHSTPHIGPDLLHTLNKHANHNHHSMHNNSGNSSTNPNCSISEENFMTRDFVNEIEKQGKASGIHFNTGSSSSSSDLTKFIQFYNDSADLEITEKWIDLYKVQKGQLVKPNSQSKPLLKSSTLKQIPNSSRTDNSSSEDLLNFAKNCGARFNNKNISESAENLYRNSHCSHNSSTSANNTNAGGSDAKENLKYSSMDVLPRSKDFRLLEKCCSVDFQTQKHMPSTRLARSKEMPNIADVDDYD